MQVVNTKYKVQCVFNRLHYIDPDQAEWFFGHEAAQYCSPCSNQNGYICNFLVNRRAIFKIQRDFSFGLLSKRNISSSSPDFICPVLIKLLAKDIYTGCPKQAERRIFSTLRAKSVIYFYII